jgi:NO-binding membrane sensor protein with MHYT domain/CheY-like chemotaxis protein/two-component sensor histidine kinase
MLVSQYQSSLVVVSIVVAIFASFFALILSEKITKLQGTAARWWIAGGAVAMGTGIWSMHFIGMLAFRLPIPIGYDWGITFVSLILPIIVSALALWQAAQPELPLKRLIISAILMGVGINAMHYTGMAAMQMQPGIIYDPLLFAASVMIAVTASGAALWIAFKLRQKTTHIWLSRIGAAVLMGLAIVGMHYTGMAAANFPIGSICGAATKGVNQDNLAILVIMATFGILTITMMASVFDARLKSRSEILALAQATSDERQVLLNRERLARTHAERMSSLKDEFLATLSHELRTPLTAILGWTYILRQGVIDEAKLHKGLDTRERNAQAQAKLIDDLLDMSRIISGKVRLELQTIDPTTFIKGAIESIRPTALSKQIDLEENLDPGADLIQGDPDRLQQVMWNLLTNAVKFTPAGGLISVSMGRQAETLQVTVRDTGIGITDEFLPHVFDRFRQEDASTTRRQGGLGLGLSIVKNLVELHGGRVEVASAGIGQGTSFTVYLPAVGEHVTTHHDPDTRKAAANSIFKKLSLVDLSGYSVLVVDDEPDLVNLISQILIDCGAHCLIATNAMDALTTLKQVKPTLMISDIGMPDMDGYELIRRVRATNDSEIANIPAIALTAFTREEDRNRALQAGFTYYMSKPVDAAKLLANIVNIVENKQLSQVE